LSRIRGIRNGIVAFTAAAFVAGAADAGGIFELDGDALEQGGVPPEDWQTLYNLGSNTGGSSVAFTGIVADPGQSTIFTGGKKDIQDITQWGWKGNGGFPDKDDITNAYAAAYSIGGDLVIYFGADRFANVGDAFMGFWFFKDHVTLNPNGSFNGSHQVGDILVLVNYPQGANAEPEIQVLEWNPAEQDVANNLHLLYSGAAALCGNVPPSLACAITNNGPSASPWPYVPKAGASGIFPQESIFEGGINLTQILGGTACFSSFLAETRSSTSITATLKDFAVGAFPVCDIEVSKACQVTRLADENDDTDLPFVVEFQGAVVNSGAGTFAAGSTVTITDDAGTPSDSSDDVIIEEALAAALAPGDEFAFSGSFFSDENPPNNTVHAAIESGGATTTSDGFTVACQPLQLNPALALSKTCWLELETVGNLLAVKVNFSGDVTNTGDVPLLVSVDDDQAGSVLSGALLMPGDSLPLSGSYLPAEADGGATDPRCANFSDTLTAIGTSPVIGGLVVTEVSAHCPLCPGSDCP
jgi:hypothetical protein